MENKRLCVKFCGDVDCTYQCQGKVIARVDAAFKEAFSPAASSQERTFVYTEKELAFVKDKAVEEAFMKLQIMLQTLKNNGEYLVSVREVLGMIEDIKRNPLTKT